MKHFILLCILCLALHVQAQDSTTSAEINSSNDALRVRVLYESAFARALPSEDAEAVASVFENDVLEAIGRNADGTWIQVRRPFRELNLGWVARRLLVYSFPLSDLPITDLTTGLIGTEPVYDTGYSVYILVEAALRAEPFFNAERIAVVPIMLTLPVLERNADSRWLKVNYLGIVGWLNSFTVSNADYSQVPISADFAPATIILEIIPPEVQLAQAYRMRDYTQTLYAIADEQANFWAGLLAAQTLPCNPPAGNYQLISVSQRDIYELPELRRAARLLPRALENLNAAVALMQECRVYSPSETSEAYANSINSRTIFGSILGQMRGVEQLLLPQIGQGQ